MWHELSDENAWLRDNRRPPQARQVLQDKDCFPESDGRYLMTLQNPDFIPTLLGERGEAVAAVSSAPWLG
jgi:hypothetical protein